MTTKVLAINEMEYIMSLGGEVVCVRHSTNNKQIKETMEKNV